LTYGARGNRAWAGGSKSAPQRQTRVRKRKKDVIQREQTEGFIENKGLSVFRGSKQTGFRVQKSPIKAKNVARKLKPETRK
jgi:hypothetical protein